MTEQNRTEHTLHIYHSILYHIHYIILLYYIKYEYAMIYDDMSLARLIVGYGVSCLGGSFGSSFLF